MNNPHKKHPAEPLFWLLVAIFIVISLGVVLIISSPSPDYGGFWQRIFRAILFLSATGLFIAKKPLGWFLAVGYFCYTLLSTLVYQVWIMTHSGPSGSPFDALPGLLVYSGFLSLLFVTILIMFLLCLPRISVGVFGIPTHRLPLQIFLATITAGIVIGLIPWAIGLP